jgi:hypothetical protein
MIRLPGMSTRKPYPSDVSDNEWALVAPYLILLPEHALREAFNGLALPDQDRCALMLDAERSAAPGGILPATQCS